MLRILIVLALASVVLPSAGLCAPPAAKAKPAAKSSVAAPGAVTPAQTAAAWYLLDTASGQALGALNADEKRDPASLTKLMTAYLVFGALRQKTIVPSQMVTVSERAWRAEGSRMFIEPRKAVSVDELLKGMIVVSGNDAALALAELVGGTEAAFVAAMNREAERLGMANTRFVNATGLSAPQQHTSAADMALLAAALIRDYPEFYPAYSLREFRYNNITQSNRNRLLWTDPHVDGVKTGHTEAAGWCLIASAHRGDRRLISVVLGAASDAARASESQGLLNWGFQTFDTVRLYQSGQPIAMLKVWKGAAPEVGAGFLADRYVSLPKGQAGKLKLTLEAKEPLLAPVASGQPLGVVRVGFEDKTLAEFPLIALTEVPSGGLFARTWDTMRLWFK